MHIFVYFCSMKATLETLKGTPAGAYLEWELKKRGIAKSRLALEVGEYPQTLVAIIKGKRKLSTSLAFRIEKKLGLEEGLLMMLQVFHEIKEEKLRTQKKPDLSKLRRGLFWDTDINTIDWEKYKQAVIERVFQRGDESEKQEIENFYGSETVKRILRNFNE
jgi:antitoxin HigA-1